MKNKLHLAFVAVVLALVASLQSNCAYSHLGPAIVSGGGGGYSSPGGWINGGFSLGPRQVPRQGCAPQRGYPQRTTYRGAQPYYASGGGYNNQGYYNNGRVPAPYPQGDMGGNYGPGIGRGVAGWVSGGGRTAPPVYFNTGDSYRY